MTLQQLEYIIALEKYGHFALAAEACGITQPTLSATIQKLEDELDTVIFDRSRHPIAPTAGGRKILDQARVILFNASQLKEMTLSEKQAESGEVHLGIIPTIAPYIVPGLFRAIRTGFPDISLHITEARTSVLFDMMDKAELDMALVATCCKNHNLLEIPVYREELVAYVSPEDRLHSLGSIPSEQLSGDNLWVLQDEHCMSGQSLNLCKIQSGYSPIYRAGSIATLVRIVDENGGYTVIPQMHTSMLYGQQLDNIRRITGPVPYRTVSIFIRKDYVRERILNVMAGAILGILPPEMAGESPAARGIRL